MADYFSFVMSDEERKCFPFCLFTDFQAYESYMKGSLLFEQDQNWDVALKHFKSARYICYVSLIYIHCLEKKMK
jgi:hypothetical protein